MDITESTVASSANKTRFQDVINDRRRERKQKAEAVCREGLQRIRDMKSKSGIDPLTLFSNEIWELIIHELGPEDKGNLWQIHPHFREMLKDNRIRDILLPQALKIDQFRHRIRNSENVPKTPNEIELYFGDDLGTLRCISKSMRNAIDLWVEDTITRNLHGIEDNDDYAYPLLNDGDDALVDKMLASFRGTNPAKHFLPRGLMVYFPTWGTHANDLENQEHLEALDLLTQFQDKVTELLKIIGDQILQFQLVLGSLRFEVEWERDEVNLSHAYVTFQHWAHLMPNMKWLRLEIEGLPPKHMSFSSTAAEWNPFPHLPKLERVRFQFRDHEMWQQHASANGKTLWIHKAVLEANRKVRQLDILANGAVMELLPTDLIKSLPLTSFIVWHRYSQDESDVPVRFEQIQPMINYEWELQTIELCMCDESIPLYTILRFLERFPLLERVALRLSKGARIGYFGDIFGYLKLPSLTHFDLKMTNVEIDFGNGSNVEWFFSLGFLLHCKKLKMMDWSLWGFDDEKLRTYLKKQEQKRHGQIVEFRAGMKVLYDSNIWNVFPSLENIHVSNWKLKNDSTTEFCTDSCDQEYKRTSKADGKLVNRFLELHSCLKLGNYQNCVLLKQ